MVREFGRRAKDKLIPMKGITLTIRNVVMGCSLGSEGMSIKATILKI